MNKLIFDFRRMKTAEAAQEYLSRKKEFPPYYGMNLDALHDVLTSITEPTEVSVRYYRPLENGDSYADKIMRVIKDSATQNDVLKLTF